MRYAAAAALLISGLAAGKLIADAPASLSNLALFLHFDGDRTRPFRTKLPVNQAYLDKIAAPPEAAVLTPAFEQLAQLQREGKLPAMRVRDVRAHAQWRSDTQRSRPRCPER